MDRPTNQFVEMTSGPTLARQPGLDGLRGWAVVTVVVFHAGLGWLPGGYLGVSVFFTISGVVISSLLLHEQSSAGAVRRATFFVRRARRLLPAALVVLAVVAVARVTTTAFSATTGGDVGWATSDVVNWHFIAQGTAYGDLFAAPSAVLHFWSLAIEWQFYVVAGLVGPVVAARVRRRAVAPGAAFLALVSFALPVVVGLGVTRTYNGTDTRAGEILVGVALGAVVSSRANRLAMARMAPIVATVAVVAGGVLLTGMRRLQPDDEWLTHGALAATAVCSTALVAGTLIDTGPVAWICRIWPAQAIGRISYTLYLVHWPVFVAAGALRPGGGVARAGVLVAISIGLAVVLTTTVETPARRYRIDQRTLAGLGAALVGIIVIATAVPARRNEADQLLADLSAATATPPTVIPGGAPPVVATTGARSTVELAAAPPTVGPTPDMSPVAPSAASATSAESARADATSPPPVPTSTAGATPPPIGAAVADTTPRDGVVQVGVVGDSISLSMLLAMGFAPDHPTWTLGPSVTDLGCGVILSPIPPADDPDRCESFQQRSVTTAAQAGTDFVVMFSCQWEVVTQPIPPGGGPSATIGDPAFDEYVTTRLDEFIDGLRDVGVQRVGLVICPYLSETVRPSGFAPGLEVSREHTRMDRWNGLLRSIADRRGDVAVVAFDQLMNPHVDDATMRPDGAHYAFDVDTGAAGLFTQAVTQAVTGPG